MNLKFLLNPRALLFSNISIRQTVAKNIFWLGFAEAMSRLLRFLLVVYAARILGAAEYGKFGFALSFAMMVGILSDFGLSTIATREVAKDKEEKDFCDSILSLKFVLSIITLFILFAASFFATNNPLIQKIIFITSFITIFDRFNEILIAFFRAHQKMEYEAFAKIFQALLTVILGFIFLFRLPNAFSLSYAHFGAGLITLLIMAVIYNKKLQPFRFKWDKTIWKGILKNSWPLGVSAIFISMYGGGHVDSVIMGRLNQIQAVGYYSAAYKLALFVLTPYYLIYSSFFPLFSSFWERGRENLFSIFNKYNEMILAFIVPIVIGSVVLADKIINFIYQSAYSSSILAFQILIFSMFLTYLSSAWNTILIISNNQKKYFYVNILGALVNLILDIILIPQYSLYGAAISVVTAYLLMAFALYFYARNIFSIRVFRFFIIPLISSLIMYLFIRMPLIFNKHIILIVLLGFAIYLIGFIILRFLVYFGYNNLLNKNAIKRRAL